jgi:hypothetical protein
MMVASEPGGIAGGVGTSQNHQPSVAVYVSVGDIDVVYFATRRREVAARRLHVDAVVAHDLVVGAHFCPVLPSIRRVRIVLDRSGGRRSRP